MKSMLRLELKKALKNPFFFISVSVMTLFSTLSAAYMVENNGEFNPNFLENYFLRDGEFYTNPMLSLTGFYNSWIGGESMSLVYSLFYTLLPVAAALPFAWSFFTERRSGYIKNVCTRTKKQYYFVAKGVAVFVSGALVTLLPLAVNLLITSALSMLQMAVSVRLRPIFCYTLSLILLLASSYSVSPWLLGNYMMAQRHSAVLSNGTSDAAGLLYAALVLAGSVLLGYAAFRKKDIVNREVL